MKLSDLAKQYLNPTFPILSFALICAPFATQADDEDPNFWIPSDSVAKNFYGGAALGYGHSNYPGSNQDGSVSGISDDANDRAFNLYAGYQITDTLAVQAGYSDLGNADFRGSSTGGPSWTAGPVSAVHDADGWELGIMGRWPIAPRWYALGYVGWMWWESKETFVESTGTTVIYESGSDASYAIGFEFDHGLKDRFVYRFMGSHREVGDNGYDVNTATAEIIYRFP